jgi:hypothetical protein
MPGRYVSGQLQPVTHVNTEPHHGTQVLNDRWFGCGLGVRSGPAYLVVSRPSALSSDSPSSRGVPYYLTSLAGGADHTICGCPTTPRNPGTILPLHCCTTPGERNHHLIWRRYHCSSPKLGHLKGWTGRLATLGLPTIILLVGAKPSCTFAPTRL